MFEEGLCNSVEEQRVEKFGGGEAFSKALGELTLDGFTNFRPPSGAVCVGDKMGEGGLGRLESHGHAVAREGRDDGVGITEREHAARGALQSERETRDGGERSLAPLRRRNALREFGVAIIRKVSRH